MVLIGFEKPVTVTKAVVNTPIDIPVKYRVAQGKSEIKFALNSIFSCINPDMLLLFNQGLAKVGWPMTKSLMWAFVGTALGFLTFISGIQEFCLIAIVSYTTDFFLQMFFFVPVLAIDIRRMEVSLTFCQYSQTWKIIARF